MAGGYVDLQSFARDLEKAGQLRRGCVAAAPGEAPAATCTSTGMLSSCPASIATSAPGGTMNATFVQPLVQVTLHVYVRVHAPVFLIFA